MGNSNAEGALASWSTPQCPFEIEYVPQVLDDIRLAVVDAFFSLPRGGAEIGGVLLGSHAAGRVTVTGHRPLNCEHAFGPSFTLSANDHGRLAELLAGCRAHGEAVVGWYHSHTRTEVFLSDADLDIHNRYFPDPWQVALVMKPHTFQPVRVGFFFREAGGGMHRQDCYREILLGGIGVRPAPLPPERPASEPARVRPGSKPAAPAGTGQAVEESTPRRPVAIEDRAAQPAAITVAAADKAVEADLKPAQRHVLAGPAALRQPVPAPPPEAVPEPIPEAPSRRVPAEAPSPKREAQRAEPAPVPSAHSAPEPVSEPVESEPVESELGEREPEAVSECEPVMQAAAAGARSTGRGGGWYWLAAACVALSAGYVTRDAWMGSNQPMTEMASSPAQPKAGGKKAAPAAQVPASPVQTASLPEARQMPVAKPGGLAPVSPVSVPAPQSAPAATVSVPAVPAQQLPATAAKQPPPAVTPAPVTPAPATRVQSLPSPQPAPSAAPDAAPLGLTIRDIGGRLQISWNRENPTVRSGNGQLEITDGAIRKVVPLDRFSLRYGSYTYTRKTERVDARLVVRDTAGKNTQDLTSFIGKLTPRKPASESELKKQRDDLARETARLKSDLSAQTERTRRAEKSVEDLKEQIKRDEQRRRLANQAADPLD